MKYENYIDAINKHSTALDDTLAALYKSIHLDNNPEAMVVFDEETELEIFQTITSLRSSISSNVAKLQELLPLAADTENQEEISEKVDLDTLRKQINRGIVRPSAPSSDKTRWTTFEQGLKSRTTEDLKTMLDAFVDQPGFDSMIKAIKAELTTRN